MAKVRQNIWDTFNGQSKASSYYDVMMMVVIVGNLIPLIFKQVTSLLLWIDHITVVFFIIDYILRWFTAGLKFQKGWKSYLIYIVSPWALLDLVCILPSIQVIASGFRILKVGRLFRTLRVFRSLKLLKNAKSIRIIHDVVKDQWRALMTVLILACGYVLIVALVMFNTEPDTFDNFFSAIYWASVTLTAIGYGDIYPLTMLGQAFTVISAFVGIAIIALPSGIIAGGFMMEIQMPKEENPDSEKMESSEWIHPSIQDRSKFEDPYVRIEKLNELHNKGIITDEEFRFKKTEILSIL